MSGRLNGRHRRHDNFDGSATAVPEHQQPQQRGLATRVGVFTAGAAVAGATVLGGVAMGPLHAPDLLSPVQHRDVALVVDPTDTVPTFQDSLQALFSVLGIGNMGDLLGALGHEPGTTTDFSTASDLSALLESLNPGSKSLDTVTGGFLDNTVGGLLSTSLNSDPALGSLTIGTLASELLGGNTATETVNDLFSGLSLGQYSGLIDALHLCAGTVFLGVCSDPVTAGSSINDLLQGVLKVDPSTETLSGLLQTVDVTVGTDKIPLTDATLADLLGISSTELSNPWNVFVSDLPVGGSILGGASGDTLGGESLGDILTSLLPQGDTVTDSTTLTEFLSDLGLLGSL